VAPMPHDLKFALAGLLVGTLVGFSGMGGGSVMTPLLILLGLPANSAVASDLAYSAITKAVGSVSHRQKKNIDWGLAMWLGIGSVPGAIIAVATVGHKIKNSDLQTALGVMLIIAGIAILYRLLSTLNDEARVVSSGPVPMTGKRKAIAISIGFAGGFAVALTSIGSGSVFAIVLMTCFPIAARRIVGTDIFHATLLLFAATGAQLLLTDNVKFGVVGALLVGSVPGVLIGSQFSGKLPERPLRLALASVLLVSGSLLV
jgi:uncharacterized membrane protein YfcA